MTPEPWWIFRGDKQPHDDLQKLPAAPPWRQFTPEAKDKRGTVFEPEAEDIRLINAALYLRRPLLITGKPGTGKTSLAYAVAHELKMGEVLRWSITTQTTLKDGLYHYDAVARLQDAALLAKKAADAPPPAISDYLRLGPLGTAFAAPTQRVLLIDEIDKSDIDLPNDLLHIFEEGEFEIPELARLPATEALQSIRPHGQHDPDTDLIPIREGKVLCAAFPLVIMTSNGEREFPPAFLRRCLQLQMTIPERAKLVEIIKTHLQLDPEQDEELAALVDQFLSKQKDERIDLATDQLLNAVYLTLKHLPEQHPNPDVKTLAAALWQPLN